VGSAGLTDEEAGGAGLGGQMHRRNGHLESRGGSSSVEGSV
jgi:hypothetical protein